MEISFNKLKQKDVISVTEGKHLGKVCDVVILYPENRVKGYFVTGCKGFRLTRHDVFIPVANIIKIGEDVILTNINEKPCKPTEPKCPPANPPQNNACPPKNMFPPCPPECFPPDTRRSYDEYE